MKIISWEEYKTDHFRRWDKEAEVWMVKLLNPIWTVHSQGRNMKEAHKALLSAKEMHLKRT